MIHRAASRASKFRKALLEVGKNREDGGWKAVFPEHSPRFRWACDDLG